mgnify:CR=1 FL=1
MTDAQVKFFDDNSADPVSMDKAQAFSFKCPMHDRRCGELLIAGRNPRLRRDPQGANGGHAMWDMSGTADKPTFSPSIDCKGCWHGFIENGRCVSVQKIDEPEPPASPRRS